MPGPRAPTSTSHEAGPFAARRRPRTGAALLALAAAVLGWGGPRWCRAAGEPPVLVLLLRQVPTSDTLAETILRIKSELRAGGFDVALEDVQVGETALDRRALVERSGEGMAPSATLGIFGDLDRGPAEMWVVDRITAKTVIRRMEVEATADRRISEVLAIRAQELLRASLVELLLERDRASSTAAAAAPPHVERWVEAKVRSPLEQWRFAFEVGGATLGGLGGVGASIAPTARLRIAAREGFWLRLTGVGWGTRPLVTGATGSARVRQDLVLFECVAWLRSRKVVRPMLSLGGGAERVGVEGSTSPPYRGESNARWFAAGDVGAGLAVRLHAHWELQLEGHALFTTPRPAVYFFDVEAARTGQPTLLAIVSLAGGA